MRMTAYHYISQRILSFAVLFFYSCIISVLDINCYCAIIFEYLQFPLLSKCGKIARILEGSQHVKEDIHHVLSGCPGGPNAFLFVAKFCYEIKVELSPKNIIMIYKIAEYLDMTEQFDERNLLPEAESFFHKSILHNWKDCILALTSAEFSLPHAESLHIVSKCINALSMMVCTDLSLFGWPMMMYGSLQSPGGSILWNGISTGARIRSSRSDWCFEDISCLGVQMFKRLIETMHERDVRPVIVAGALMHYTRKHLPGLDRWQKRQVSRNVACLTMSPAVVDHKMLLETIVNLLPEKKGKSYCRFLLGLLRFAVILNVCQSCKESLERTIGMQLELATLDGLLVPNFSDSDNLYDTDCVQRIINHFVSSQESRIATFSPPSSDSTHPSSSPLNRVIQLIDSYIAEVAPDINLGPGKMLALLLALPKSARNQQAQHDGLYRALDRYLKAHPWLLEKEKMQLCSTIDYGKLSVDACVHASQNERLPHRIILQVLFFEQLQLRMALSHYLDAPNTDSTAAVNNMAGNFMQRDGWISLLRENRVLRVDMESLVSRVRNLEQEFVTIKQQVGRMNK
ncbi:hypothetical protein Cni_G10981 [Canna indica]|uniref:NPH3 domain-containing protein n=1 Tax=Canna indica TaxID=4628 RepID=A0AAQ3K5I7_9LILI|nr:hypothetical protein Cni_G10981 [Canna indica]